ncbi:TolC family outer membrane protein [Novosphingobium kaempferiae]|uniref:TolC family outer membrane protein n=1 Tax=Novosphingobium kaempferiae TaxID=2896849 RepID=UPI001E577200|nr:TolC family outer membrane protein [Novosphingobium kaempferiae]
MILPPPSARAQELPSVNDAEVPGPTIAAPPPPHTLAAVLAAAYRSNPTLQASRYDLRSADERIAQANAELRTSADIQANAGYQWSFVGDAGRSFFSPSYSQQSRDSVTLSVQQPVYTSGHATFARRSAEASIAAARSRLNATEGDLMLSIVAAYIDVRRLEVQRTLRTGSVEELRRLEQEIEARQQAGELTRTDVAQAMGQIEQAEQRLVQTEQALESVRADFVSLVGEMPENLAEPPPLPMLPASTDRAFALAEADSPELAYARYTEQASRQDIGTARSAGGPTVAIRGSAAVSGPAYPYAFRDQNKDFAASVVLSLPLLSGGRTASRIREARARNDADRLRIEGARRDMVRAVTNAWNQVAAADRAADITERRRQVATTQLEGMLAEYRVGLRSTFDVLYAQQNLRDAEVSTLDAQRDQYLSRATLLRRVGLLDIDDLTVGIPTYDPARHAKKAATDDDMPWDGAFRAIDTLGASKVRARPIAAPAPAQQPAIRSAQTPDPIRPDYVKQVPLAPAPGTTAANPPARRPLK